ncbi:MAG: hypothetical protein D6707_02215 [Bacteroidetes bacterium]|nr:MAG: hypothetical protein D6707_02215 [Bacteroidota bacterium]
MLTIFFGCIPESKKNEPRKIPGPLFEDSATTRKNDKDIAIFPLPTPFQTVSILKSFELPYSDSLNQIPANISTLNNKIKKAFYLGVCSVDIGYNLAYNRLNDAQKQHQIFTSLLNDLNIPYTSNLNFGSDNTAHINTLINKYIHEFETGLNYLTGNKLSELHLATIIGVFSESLYISVTVDCKNHVNIRKNLIKQHRLFCDSLLKLIVIQKLETKLEPLYHHLLRIRDYYDALDKQENYEKNNIFVLRTMVKDLKQAMLQ